MKTFLLTATTLGILFAILASPATADDLPRATAAVVIPEDPLTARIREELRQPTQFNFVETPLSEIVDALRQQHGIQIELDNRSLEELGLGSDIPITRELKEVTLRSALNLMLGELDLTYVVRNQTLLITTLDAAQDQLSTRVYPVADLVQIADDGIDYSELTKVIAATVDPDSWDDAGGPGSMVPFRGTLVISQIETVHDEIADLFDQLRRPEAVAAREALQQHAPAAKAVGSGDGGGMGGKGGGFF